jgi:uncharacterized protein YecE (DUF72 family)
LARIRIGTSGWQYGHWVGPFYPKETAARDRLSYYAGIFDAVEINSTFYSLPSDRQLARWCDDTPAGFIFACKASRYITHMKKLSDPKASLRQFFKAVDKLGDRLGPILFQLPPRWNVNTRRLEEFLVALPKGYCYAFEFRDLTWLGAPTYERLEHHNAALCIYDFAGTRSPAQLTADFSYVRLHGPGRAYEGQYDGRSLGGWARRIRGWQAAGNDVYLFFDNDQAGHAAQDARRLIAIIERAG